MRAKKVKVTVTVAVGGGGFAEPGYSEEKQVWGGMRWDGIARDGTL